MRKIVSFLALLVVAFALPHRALAWNYDGGEDPSKIVVHLTEGTNADIEMEFDKTITDYKWSGSFTAKSTFVKFDVQVWNKAQDYDATYGTHLGAETTGAWVTVNDNPTGGKLYQNGLTNGHTYRVEIKNGTGDASFMYRFVDITETERTTLYLYDTAGPTEIASAERDADGNYTFELDLAANKYFVLSLNKGATTWTGVESGYGRYSPASDKNVPGANIKVYQTNNGAWKATKTGKYTIHVNWNDMTLTATCAEGGDTPEPPVSDAPASLYLYTTPWGGAKYQAALSTEGTYKYTVNLTEGQYVDLSTVANATDWAGLSAGLYAPDGDAVEIVDGEPTSFAKRTGGAWQAKKDGRYTIIVDWENKTFTATIGEIIAPTVHLPLTSADFKDGKKHYFLVGERMGEWHLQPEWELEVKGNKAELPQRYIYNQKFAVAVVSSYSDYIDHKYMYYSWGGGAVKNMNASANDVTLAEKAQFSPVKGQNNNNKNLPFNNWLYSAYDTGFGGDQDYYQGRGRYMSNIVLDLDASGNPAKLTFVPGTTEEAAKNRVFTLVGSNIYNNQYCNTSGEAKTPTWNEKGTTDNGWQEGWIQYDPATNRPYVDGRGEYLYLTSFTPAYMTANPVRFQQTLADGTEFAYASGQVRFIEWSNLPNLDTDPYKDFYTAFTGNKTISDSGEKISGNGYDFNLKTENKNNSVTPTAGWNCYVVRDMWVAGEVKFWTGWGGNQDYTNGGGGGMCVFHGPNGGPDITKGEQKPVKGYDINSGLDAVLYKNARNLANTNYEISDKNNGKPVYFNRVVLWFNNTDGVNNSFIQFIQESAGPAIFAQAVDNTLLPEKKNYIKYNWYLNKSQNETQKEHQVLGYEIRRYRVVDNVTTFIGYPEKQYEDISDKNVKVEDLYEENAGKWDFTSHIDTGVDAGGNGFAPGIYQYDIYVTYKDNVSGDTYKKLAWSNRVPIYDDNMVTPDAIAMQLIELRDAYTDQFGLEHASGQETLGTTKRYLTYRPNDNANFYVMDQEVKDITITGTKYSVTLPKDAEMIDARTAIKFIAEHPDKFWWTSDYYMRCLDYNEYESTLQGFIDQGLIKGTEVPHPILQVNEAIKYTDAAGDAQTWNRVRGYAQPFDFGDKTYYSVIVKRDGNLADANLTVQLRYSYVDAEDNEKTPQTTAMTQIDPVVPRPFDPLYRYTYARPDRTLGDEYDWGKILVPVKNWKHATTDEAIAAGDLKEVYVKFDDDFDPREFTLQVDFYRPNVNYDICKFYDIQYNIKVVNKDQSVPLDIDAVLHDLDTDKMIEDESGNQVPLLSTLNRYRMEFKGLHPRNAVYPVVTFVKTEYVPKTAVNPAGDEYQSQTGNYGKMLEIEAKRSLQVNTNPEGLQNVHLGKIKRADGTWDWMYKGHEDFKDDDETLEPTGNEYEDISNDVPVKPLYYLIELKNSIDEAVYEYLVPHKNGHIADKDNIVVDPSTGLLLNDTDPLIGTYIGKGFTTEETPEVVATAIYMFERPWNGEDTGNYTNFNRLEVESITFNKAETSKKMNAPARVRDDVTSAELANGGQGDLPDTGVAPEGKVLDMSAADETTGYNAYIAVKGATYNNAPDDKNVTGVEDVIAGAENGDAVYYNMQGMRVAEPTSAGVYLKVQGKTVSKIVIE